MPVSRNKKYKKKKKKVSRKQTRKPINTKGVAPAPIKMRYVEASFNNTSFSTFDERLNEIRKVGRDAAERFPLKYRSIQNWFKKYDQVKLLS
ncbi:MAG TPA: hypothetical protein VHA52_05045, partial [Candidatus Babeliaceae bacterium]|nr:hypothetical protein [Candidatus Babeliaceae bacterium]